MKAQSFLLFAIVASTMLGFHGPWIAAEDAVPRNAAGSRVADPFVTGQFSWLASQPLIGPVDHGGDPCYSIKDPSIVRYDGRWHLFTTLRSEKRSHQIEYLSFTDWNDATQAERQLLDLTPGDHCAPQVF